MSYNYDDFGPDEDLATCPQCNEKAWDGRICHACGAKDIGE